MSAVAIAKVPWQALGDTLEGELLLDEASRVLYATDASLFETIPLAVVVAKNKDDCQKALVFCWRYRIPVIPRAAGTSLAGQCVGSGIVIDSYRYLNQVESVDLNKKTATVQPGVVPELLNQKLASSGLFFPIDPSSKNRCSIGGMVGNNAWGAHSPVYGTTRDMVISIDGLLADGSEVKLHALGAQQLKNKCRLQTLEGSFYRCTVNTVSANTDLILKNNTPADVPRNNSGYALDVLANNQPFNLHGDPFNLSTLICGSEGTLAFITAIEVRLSPVPDDTVLVCAHFSSLHEALDCLPVILSTNPSVVELIDKQIISACRENPLQQQNASWIEGQPQAVLLIELTGRDASKKAAAVVDLLKDNNAYASPILREGEEKAAWAIRRSGLGLLMGRQGPLKAVSAIEDSAVPVDRLAEFVKLIQELMRSYGLTCVYYGSVSLGLLHLRPWMDLSVEGERDRLKRLLQDTATCISHCGGVVSAKHGDGKVRGWLLDTLLGTELVGLMRQIKASADPHNLLNPGKGFNANDVFDQIRANKQDNPESDKQNLPDAVLHWHTDAGQSNRAGFGAALLQCNGAGVCISTTSGGVMCPSYQATGLEKNSTRGRANLLRLMYSDRTSLSLDDTLVDEAMELCLGCKGCKKECPAGVDMSRLKAEYLQQKNNDKKSMRTRVLSRYLELSRWTYLAGAIINNPLSHTAIKTMMGFHRKRSLPTTAKKSLLQWYCPRPKSSRSDRSILLLVDPQLNYYEPAIGKAAIRTLEQLGVNVAVTEVMHSTRVLISEGLLSEAKTYLNKHLPQLHRQLKSVDVLLGLEPSEILTFRDEIPDLVDESLRSMARDIAEKSRLFDEYVIERGFTLDDTIDKPMRVVIHDHCHQKALAEKEVTSRCLALIPGINIQQIDSGCCGMAGVFGMQKEHYGVSMKIARQVLAPAIQSTAIDTMIVANGSSCRSQIYDATGRRALHSVEVFYRYLKQK